MRKFLAAFHLLGLFIKAVIASGFSTLQVIVRRTIDPSSLPPARFVRLPFAPMSEWGASLLASMITLTPGTTAIDIDMQTRHMLLHVLDATDIDSVINSVRNTFEPDLVILFGEKS